MRFIASLLVGLLACCVCAEASADIVYRINAGGPDYVDPAGNTWRSDSALGYFNIGESFSVDSSVEIAETTLDPIFRSHRYDSSLANPEMIYTFPVDPGFYSVRLYFAETYWGFEGRRRFGVDIESETVLVDYDIVGLTGGKYVADVQQFLTEVVDGDPTLTITFTHGSIDHPLVCAIVIESVPPSPIIMNGESASLAILKNSNCSNAANLLALEAADPDTDPAILQWMITSGPSHGDVSFLGGEVVGSDVIVCYTPAENQVTADAFTIAVTDGDVGNIDEIDVSVAIVDTQAPTIVCPADLTLEADASFTPSAAGVATGTDDFGAAPTISYSDIIVAGSCPIAIELERTWKARDAAGNIATCMQRISIMDNDTDADGSVDCDDIAPNDAQVGGSDSGDTSNDNASESGADGGDDDGNGNDNFGTNGVGFVDPGSGQPIPTDECCGGGLPAMLPFMMLGWRRRRRAR